MIANLKEGVFLSQHVYIVKNITLTNIENERIDVDIDPNSDIDDNDDYRIEDKKLQLIRKIKWEYNYLFYVKWWCYSFISSYGTKK